MDKGRGTGQADQHGDEHGDEYGELHLIDWDLAGSLGRRLISSGPKVAPEEAAQAVAELRDCALAAQEPVAVTTGLRTGPDAPPARVVDRGRWIEANVASFRVMFEPVLRTVAQRSRAAGRPAPPEAFQTVSGKLTGAEVAALLAYLSGKILGQYDLAPGRPADRASLLLVAPNIVEVERELGVDPRDFRLWVCLHEETHRVQFTAVPWLREHMLAETDALAVGLAPDPDAMMQRIRELAGNLREVVSPGGSGLAGLFLSPEQKARVARLTAVMSLLEGHADVVMDEVGPQVVPSVAEIRRKFEKRRDGLGIFDVMIRRLLGMEAKMAQYRTGAVFVRGVMDQVGLEGFNAVWSGPEQLPRPEEIAEPRLWVDRVHGRAAITGGGAGARP